ncbi:28S ribosomal protein S2, mitochondrial [Anthophora retusa]
MTSIITRTFSSKLRRDWSILRPFLTYPPKHKLSTAAEEQKNDIKDLKSLDPLNHPDFFHVYDMFTVKDLFEAKTAELLRQALNFTAHIAYQGGIILFIAKNPQISYLIENTAKECEEYAHTRHWKHGTFTNANHEFKAAIRLPDLCIFLNTMESVVKQHRAVVHAAKMAIPTEMMIHPVL